MRSRWAATQCMVRTISENQLAAHCLFPYTLYRSTGEVWQTLNISKSPSVPNHLIVYGAVRGQISHSCLGVLCRIYYRWYGTRAGGSKTAEGCRTISEHQLAAHCLLPCTLFEIHNSRL